MTESFKIKYVYPPIVENAQRAQSLIARHYPCRGIYQIIFGYAQDETWATPVDRVIWLNAEIQRRSEAVDKIDDWKIRNATWRAFQFSEMRQLIDYKNPLANVRKTAILLSQLYCLVFARPNSNRFIPRKEKADDYFRHKYYEDVTPYFLVPGATKNFQKIDSATIMQYGRAIVDLIG